MRSAPVGVWFAPFIIQPLPAKGGTIMQRESIIVRERQLVIRRELDRRGIAMKIVAMDSAIPYSSLLSYFPVERAELDGIVTAFPLAVAA